MLQRLLDLSCIHVVLDIGDIGSTRFRFVIDNFVINKIPDVFRKFQDTIYISAKTFWLAGGVRLVNARDFSLQLDGTLKFRAGRTIQSHPNICPKCLRLFTKVGFFKSSPVEKKWYKQAAAFFLSRHILDFNRKRGTWIFMKLEMEPQVEVVGRNSVAMCATSTRCNLIGIRSLVLTDFGGLIDSGWLEVRRLSHV